MDNTGHAVILVTAGSESEALRIRDALLSERRAACVSIVRDVNSVFWWQGKLESAQESLLVVKTRTSQIDEIVNLVKQNHSYTMPEVIALPIIGGNPEYLDWMEREVPESLGRDTKDVDRGRTPEIRPPDNGQRDR
jgi:periplasmic divalent cation tolerance protein